MKGYNEDAPRPEYLKKLGFWIMMKRRELGYTREELERISGVSRYTIRNLELPNLECIRSSLQYLIHSLMTCSASWMS